ncbi:MarR family transcriptional regulator [Saccharibacillus sp. CPCC 101409]|uniref:MarR family winged helix-turn-helix transcriptional regulator n=1 Tax=Saccharibacillus sp. CPCC 101409 TaxID=3058041 RepID=UPI002670F11E|nr:MarR family transcriptional regulator [Saccharibacillus sp. CPCC 101409]MDO3413263.1 MarR family transcriptional regulator [Saccharibacillus sp. CPCC 101409]
MNRYNAAALISRINDQAQKLITSELEKRGIEGIVPSHGGVLMFLYRKDELSVTELAEAINRTQPTLTVLVNKLEKLGYVKRSKSREDQRVTLIGLTPKGRELEPVFREVSDLLNETLYGGLSAEEGIELERLLENVQDRF